MMGFVFRFDSQEINIRSAVLHKNLFYFFSTGNNPCFKSIPFSLALNINSDYEMILQFKGNSRFPYEMCFHSFGWKKFFFVNFSSWKAINPNDLQQSTLTFFPSSFLPSFLYVLGGILFCGWRWGRQIVWHSLIYKGIDYFMKQKLLILLDFLQVWCRFYRNFQ